MTKMFEKLTKGLFDPLTDQENKRWTDKPITTDTNRQSNRQVLAGPDRRHWDTFWNFERTETCHDRNNIDLTLRKLTFNQLMQR